MRVLSFCFILIVIYTSRPKSNKTEDEHFLISTSLGFMHFYFHVSPSVSALTRDGQVEEAKDPLAHLKSTHHHPVGWVGTQHMSMIRVRFMPSTSQCPFSIRSEPTWCEPHHKSACPRRPKRKCNKKKRKEELDPVGSTVRYEMMKLCTGSV